MQNENKHANASDSIGKENIWINGVVGVYNFILSALLYLFFLFNSLYYLIVMQTFFAYPKPISRRKEPITTY